MSTSGHNAPKQNKYATGQKAQSRATAPKISIIILNWNNADDTIECLDSLKNLEYPNYEIVVVDNGSSDNSVKQLQRTLVGADPPKGVSPPASFTLLEQKSNLGFSGGNNIGIKYAFEHEADYVLLLNNDTVVEPDPEKSSRGEDRGASFLKKLIKVAESDGQIGIVGPRINYFNPRNLIWFNGGKFGWPLKYNNHLDFRKKEDELKNFEPKEVDFITGCSMLVKHSVFDKIGLLDECFFLYFEDMDFCLRAKKAGFKVIVVPGSKIFHKVSASTRKLENPVIWYYHIRNYLLLVKKNKNSLLNLATQLWGWWMYGKQILKAILWPREKEQARIIRQAVKDFYRGEFGKIKDN